MPIYTRTGDKGKTSLFTGQRVWKDSLRVDTYGTVDELNSVIGVVLAHIDQNLSKKMMEVREILLTIQSDLFYIGACLADPSLDQPEIDLAKRVDEFEHTIDRVMAQAPPLQNFILPGGGVVGSLLQFARTVSRRAERRVTTLSKKEKIHSSITIYINRLSDLFFGLSRYANFVEKKQETIWIGK